MAANRHSAGLGVLIAGHCALLLWMGEATFDDVHASFRYAAHLAAGLGLTFDPALAPTEGYSNPALVLWVAMTEALVPGSAAIVAKATAALCSVATLWLLDRALRREGVGAAVRWAALAVPALSPIGVYWVATGTDNAMFGLALVGFVAAARRQSVRPMFGWALLLAFSRAEGPAVSAGLVGVWWLGCRDAVRPQLHWAFLWLIPVAAYLAFRVAYFGEWLPNTVIAKSAEWGTPWLRGTRRLWQFSMATGVVWSAFVLLGIGVSLRRRQWLLAVAALGGLAFVVKTGGDVNFPRFRFVALYVPLFAWVAAHGLAGLLESPRLRARSGAAIGAAALCGAALAFAVWRGPTEHTRVHWRTGQVFDGHRRLAERVTASLAPGAVIAVYDIGILPHAWMGYGIVDLSGLTDRTIARLPREGLTRSAPELVDYVLDRDPDAWVLNSRKLPDGTIAPDLRVVAAIMADPRFASAYRPVAHEDTVGPRRLVLWVRREPGPASARQASRSLE